MSSYLVAIVVGNFAYVEGSADGIPIRVYASTGKKELGTFALAAAEYNLRFYDNYFGIRYPYGKLDLVGLADFSAGAMENTGCITFSRSSPIIGRKARRHQSEENCGIGHRSRDGPPVVRRSCHYGVVG